MELSFGFDETQDPGFKEATLPKQPIYHWMTEDKKQSENNHPSLFHQIGELVYSTFSAWKLA